jgi:hypothetical protein
MDCWGGGMLAFREKDSRRVAAWICDTPADIHIAEWRRLIDSVKGAP